MTTQQLSLEIFNVLVTRIVFINSVHSSGVQIFRKMANLQAVCELMDKQYIHLLELIEKDVSNKIYLEKQMNSGSLLIAKTRYLKGQQTVSSAQLPSDDSDEFKALSTVERDEEAHWSLMKKHPVDKEKGFIDPLRWFGVLVPQSLQLAKDKFRNCLFLIVEQANIQSTIQRTIRQLLHLKNVKFQMQTN